MQTTNYKLDITPGGVPLTIHISQYDVGLRQYIFQPYTSVGEFAYVSGATVTLEATKPDGYAVIQNCTYSSEGIITYTLQDQLAAKPGKVWSKIVIRDGDDVLGTGTIVWLVDEAGVKDSAIVSESDVTGIRGLVDTEIKNAMFSFLPTESASGIIAHFDDGADDVPVKDLKIGIVPQQSGTGDPSPSNIRPITGWTGATVKRTGANLVKFVPVDNATHKDVSYSVTSDGRLTMSGKATANSQPYNTSRATTYSDMPWGEFPAGTYTITCLGYIGQSASDRVIMNVMDCDGTTIYSNVRIASPTSTIPDGTGRAYTFTANKPFKFGLYIIVNSGSTVNCTLSLLMEVGETLHEYEPLNEQTYPISWETEAGTVYSGNLDVTTGVLTVDKGVMDIGNYTWSYDSSWTRFSTTVSDMKSYGTRLTPYTASCYVGIDDGRSLSNVPYGGVYSGQSGTYDIYIKENSYTDPAAFKTARTGQKIVYPLKNTLVYQLTPTEVRSLLGINNIWSDTGDAEAEYKADMQMYMDKRITATKSIIAGIETGYTASQNYTTGQFLIVGDNLYKATANIASGATIAVGTNVVSTTVAEQLIALANA